MTSAVAPAAPPAASWTRYGVGAVVGAAGLALLLFEANVRLFEAGFSATVMRLTGTTSAKAAGASVIFPHAHQWIGFTVAASCSAALLVFPFFLVTAGLVAAGRLTVPSALGALGIAGGVVWLANQLRLLVIGASMRLWGFQTGYSRSHVLAGGVISTLGVGLGIAAFVALLLHQRRPGGGRTGPDLPDPPQHP